MNISKAETEIYTELWESVPAYRRVSPGERYAELFHSIVNDSGATVLDAGCGAGQGILALSQLGYRMAGVDLVRTTLVAGAPQVPIICQSLWNDLKPAVYLISVEAPDIFRPDSVDYVYSCDVLEHLPEQFTMLAIQRMLEVAQKGVFISLMQQQEIYGSWVGRRLHLTVKPFIWWRDSMREIAEVVEARDVMANGIFYLRAK